MNFNVSKSANHVNISICSDKFMHHLVYEFRELLLRLPKQAEYIIDFSRVHYMDSLGLGMLMVLREYNGNGEIPIKLVNCRNHVRSELDRACFHRLFTIT
jgi:anti-anti-sigma factor